MTTGFPGHNKGKKFLPGVGYVWPEQLPPKPLACVKCGATAQRRSGGPSTALCNICHERASAQEQPTMDHSELLKDARAGADALANRCHVTAATTIRELADLVEAYDKAESECAAACKTCVKVIGIALTFNPECSGELYAARRFAKQAVANHEQAKGGR